MIRLLRIAIYPVAAVSDSLSQSRPALWGNLWAGFARGINTRKAPGGELFIVTGYPAWFLLAVSYPQSD
jgi:hypothetical protein